MKKPLHHVTDHAIVRYLERVEGMDIDAVRARISRKVEVAIELEAGGQISGGFIYKLNKGTVTTVVPQNEPKRRTRRRPRTGELPDV